MLLLALRVYDGVRRACRVQGKRPEQALRAIVADTQLLEMALGVVLLAAFEGVREQPGDVSWLNDAD